MTIAMQLSAGPALVPDFVTGASILCILAWPTSEEIATYHRVCPELLAEVVRKSLKQDPAGIFACQRAYPQQDWDAINHLAKSKSRMAAGLLQKRLNHRMAAARMGLGLAHEQIFAKPALLPPSVTALSIDQLARLVRSDTTIDDSDNIEKLVWRPTLPIVHLAMAVQLLLAGRFGDRVKLGTDLQDLDFYREAIYLATLFEPMVAAHPRFAIGKDEQTRVRWYE